MKRISILLALAGLVSVAQASEFAPVIAKSEIIKSVPVSRQVCSTETVEAAPDRSAAGAVIGGVAGGVLGHTVGKGGGKLAATVVGAIAGTVVGDRLDNQDATPTTQQVQRCHTVREQQDQLVGYRVTYEYAGKQYSTRMARDPGDRVELQISVVGADVEAPPVIYREVDGPRPRRF